MKFKSALFACIILCITSGIKADFKDNLTARFAQTLEFVQSEKTARSVKIGIGSQALAFSIFSLCEGIKFLNTCPYERTKSNYLRLFSIPTTIVASCYMLNDGLNNKPNEAIRSLIQKAKAQLQRPKVNEQK